MKPPNKIRQVSIDMIIDSSLTDDKLYNAMTSAMRTTLVPMLKARIGITEVVHTLTDKGPMYVPVTELKEKEETKIDGN